MGPLGPRYLVPFHPKRVPHHFTDVLIIGGGLAGLRAALAIDPSLRVLVVTKQAIEQSNSNYAQGGIAGVMDPEDRFENHVADTLRAGGDLCDEAIVELVVREAPRRIRELMDWGARFDTEAGELALGREGGHSHDRIVHALGDSTGREVMRAVIERTRGLENVDHWGNTFTLDLLTHDGAGSPGFVAANPDAACRGALVWNAKHGKTFVWAKQTILCTGGCGQIYRETTNPDVATGDGHAIAYRAGAELRDMEFMQFHPTVLYIAGSSRNLITEAMRGEGAWLVDRAGRRFMADYDSRLELAPRDIVSQSIVSQMEKTRHPNVYLDLSHLDPERVRKRFPGIAAACKEFGIDIARDRIPVRPGAHYMIGGVTTDTAGKTTVPGLWAAGEVTSTGLHGANRLASNSLLEGLVFGAHAGEGASEAALSIGDDFRVTPLENAAVAHRPGEHPPNELTGDQIDLVDIRNTLKSLMWHSVGVRRERSGLADAAETVDRWCRYVLNRQFATPQGWELQNMIVVARLMTAAALEREESRGTHLRLDFPQPDPAWKRHLAFRR